MVTVPDPWAVLARTDVQLMRLPIPEMGRYYDAHRTIVLRSDLLLVEERAVLWHELVHSQRRDQQCVVGVLGAKLEVSVDREAARLAMPYAALAMAALGRDDYAAIADALKTTETLLAVRLAHLHPAERAGLLRINDCLEWAA